MDLPILPDEPGNAGLLPASAYKGKQQKAMYNRA